jgi:hypothetical protein
VRNRSAGFYANHHPGGIDWIHNSAFRNGLNYNFLGRSSDASSDIPGRGHKILNNLSYGTTRDVGNVDPTGNERAGNSFDQAVKLTDSDFLSLDESALTAPRQPDGELPAIRFLHPASGNPFTGIGAAGGMAIKDTAPDVGASERQGRTSVAAERVQ